MALNNRLFKRLGACTIIKRHITGNSPPIDPVTMAMGTTSIPGFNPLKEDSNPKIIKGDKANPKRESRAKRIGKEFNEIASYKGRLPGYAGAWLTTPDSLVSKPDLFAEKRELLFTAKLANKNWKVQRGYQFMPYGIGFDESSFYWQFESKRIAKLMDKPA